MKSLYKIIFLFVLIIFNSIPSYSINKTEESLILKTVADPSGQITGNATVCQNATAPLITFDVKDDNGKEPYTFTYTINGGAPINVSTTGNNSITVVQATNVPGTFSYILTAVKDKEDNDVALSSNKTVTIVVNPLPVVNFTFTNNQCSGTAIQFNSTVSGNQNFSYLWDFGDNSGGNTSTNPNPSHVFSNTNGNATQSFNVTLTVTDNNGCEKKISKVVSIQSPDTTLNSDADSNIYNDFKTFRVCTNTNSVIQFINASTTLATNNKYTINWGDSTTDFSSNSFSTISHNYSVGLWTLTYTVTSQNGCTISRIYKVFVGNNPAVGIGNPGNTNICISTPLTFPITGTENNPPGTIYTITFNDGSNPTTFNHPPPATITHTFLKSSCGVTSGGQQNSFSATIEASNPCDVSIGTVVPIRVSTPPVANFNIPQSVVCTNKPICITNTTIGGEIPTNSSCGTPKMVWIISPSTGFTLSSGALGNDNNGSSNINTWTAGTNEICPIFNAPGTYTITLRVAGNLCSFDQITKTICVESPLLTSFTLNNNSGCANLATTATNTTIVTNSCSPPTYVWSVTYASAYCGTSITPIPNQTTTNASFNFTEPGTYTIKLTATNACSPPQVATQVVTVKKPPTATINAITVSCGTTTINPTATIRSCTTSAASLSYAWSFPGGNPATSSLDIPGTISYPSQGNYTVSLIVTNDCGPSATATKPFTISDAPTITNTSLTQTICSGSSTALVNLTSSPAAATISWTATATAGISGFATSGTNTIPIQTIITTSSSSGTITYSIKPTLSSCIGALTTYTITVNPAPTITAHPAPSTICQGGTPNVLSVSISSTTATISYQWYSNTVNNTNTGTAITGETNSNYTPPSTIAGTIYYYCVITLSSGGCSAIKSNTAAVTILANTTITVQPLATQNLCVGVTIPSPLSINNTGGSGNSSYQWFSNTTNANTGGSTITGATSSTYTMPVFTMPGKYYYYAVVSLNGNGCVPAASNVAEVMVYADPTISLQPISSQTICLGTIPSNLEVTATGGNGAFTYQWYSNVTNSDSGGTVITSATNSSFSPAANAIGTKYYYCVVIQNSTLGCSVTSTTAAISVNSAATITKQPTSSTSCLGGTPTPLSVAYSNGVGTASYQWYSNTSNTYTGGTAITTATTTNFTPPNTVVGTVYYYCVITLSSGGCSNLTSSIAEVVINQNPVISSKTTLICSGNSFTIAPQNSAGDIVPSNTLYSWTTPIVSPAGVISGATAQTTPQPTISQTLVNSTSNPATVTYTVTPISGLCKGNTFTIVVTVNPSISSTVTLTNSSCFGANNGEIKTSSTGGIPFSTGPNGFTYKWTGPNEFTSTVSDISNLPPGNYDLSITDAGGCPITKTYTITEPNDIIIGTDLQKNSTCFNKADGSISITVSGGTLNYSYAWTKNGSPYSTLEDISNLAPGTYIISVSDAKNCGPKTATFTITEPPILDVSLISKTDLLCSGQPSGAIAINVVGGTAPYNYAWTGPNGFISSNKDLGAIAAGTYNLAVTDISGCSKTLSVTLTQPSEIIITATTTPIICYGNNDATIKIVVAGGVAPYTISWSNLASGTFQDNLSSGDYLITVTDVLNCTTSLNVNIPEAPIFTVNPVIKNISCFGDKNGSINLNFIGGIAPVKLTWNDSSVAGTVRNNLGPGSYTVTIVDSKPCTIKRTFIILEPQLLVLSANVTNAFDCDNANSGAINLLIAGGTAPFTYVWSNGATTEDLANIPAGNYLVTVKDANGCSKQAQYSINRPPPIDIGVATKTEFDCETKYVKQNFVAQVSGGVPPYQLSWSNGTVSDPNNEIMNTSQNGTAILYVTDALGCKANYSFNVELSSLGTPSFNASSYSYLSYGNYSINDPIQFTNTATGDYISMVWDFGDGTSSAELNPVHTFINPKEYVVTQTVTYPFGCVDVQKITFNLEKGYLLVVPNAFTPNDDTINDTFRPVTKALKNVRLDIYDTWGSLIYSETGDVLRGWDAKIKGVKAENGNYFCKVSGETFYGTIVNVNHPFVLIK